MDDPFFFVSWPAAPLTESLVRNSLLSLPRIDDAFLYPTLPRSFKKLIQWSSYDEIDHALTVTYSDHHDVLSSSFVIRKALIRKHFLSRCIHSYLTKRPDSVLQKAVPKTWDIEISFADDLDDLWADELWDLSDVLDDVSIASPETHDRWWILKPGMADRGMGIRLFDSKESLRRILEKFDDDYQSCDGDGDGDSGDRDEAAAAPTDNTTIAISQLRHFVIQASSGLAISTYRDMTNSNKISRNTYQVLSCLIRKKSP
jgi:tubulin---tyrosine ligase